MNIPGIARTRLACAVLLAVLCTPLPARPQQAGGAVPGPAGTEKIYSLILNTLGVLRAEGITAQNAPSMDLPRRFNTRLMQFDASGRMGLNLDVESVSQDLLDRIAGLGGEVVHAIPEARLVAAWIPIGAVTGIAEFDEVRIVRPMMKGVVNTGSVTSEGDALHHAADVRDDLNVMGDSIRVGVISDGCFTWAASQALGDLPGGFGPPDFTFLNGVKSGPSGDEGTAMMEVVHDLSPNSELAFYGALSLGGSATMIDAIQRLVREKSCDVIVDDLTYFDQPMFEDNTPATSGMIAAAAQWAVDTGVVYVSSAGNWAKGGATDRSHYQANFSDNNPASNTPVKPLPVLAIPQPAPPGGYAAPFDQLHDFDPGAGIDVGLMVIMPPLSGGEPSELDVILEWNEAWGISSNDFDLYLYDATMSAIKASSTTFQLGAQNAYEAVAYSNGYAHPETLNVVINLHMPPVVPPQLLGLYISGCTWVEYNTPENSIWGQPGVPDVIAVGAVPYSNITQSEIYSSRGHYDVYFPVYASRPKPDVSAVDGNAITGTGGFGFWDGMNWRFYGTSSSAPHAAGMAALMLSQYPAMTPAEVRSKFHRTAVDLGDPGFDPVSGYGRADIEIAMLEVDTAVVASAGPYSDTSEIGVPSFLGTSGGYAVATMEVAGGTGPPTEVQASYSVTAGDPYDDAGVRSLGCPTIRRWYDLSQTGGTSGLFDALVTAYVDESERQAAGIAGANLRLLHWNGSWFDMVPEGAPPEQMGQTWKITASMTGADFSPFFVGHLLRGIDLAGVAGEGGMPDSTVVVKFTMHNTGNGWDTLRCHLTDTRGWTILNADTGYALTALEADTLGMPVTISGTDTAGVVDTVTMVVRSLSDTSVADTAFVAVAVTGGIVTVGVKLAGGWNMVSVPTAMPDMSWKSLYPDAVSRAYRYDIAYRSEDTLELGRGYWIKLPAPDTLDFSGTARDEDSVDVVRGWNMIGTLSSAVAVGDVVEVPDGIVLSVYYGFNETYFTADSLRPGRSYWVKVSAAGKLVLSK